MIDEKKPSCPACKSTHVDRIEVDIGVGIQCGPWSCYDCGWGEEPHEHFFAEFNDEEDFGAES